MKTQISTVDEGSFKMAKRGSVHLRKLTRKSHYNVYTRKQLEDGSYEYLRYSKLQFLDATKSVAKWANVDNRSLIYTREFEVNEYGTTWLVSMA